MESSKIDLSKAASLYNDRFDLYGKDIKTVGWGKITDQQLRFEVLFRGIDPTGKTVLDVGCGIADLIPFLEKRTAGNFKYIGVDIADKLIENARKNYTQKGIDFYIGDIFSVTLPKVDIAVNSGALSFKVEGIEQYAEETMKHMYQLSHEAACLNFLSKYVDFELEKNQHYAPEAIFSKAKQLTHKVNLIHDYPLYEFTVQLFK